MTPFLNVRRRVRAVVRRGAFGACVLASVSAHADAPPPPTTTSPPPPVRSDATAADDDEVVSVAQAVREAARKSPTLRAALLDLQEVTSTVAAEEDRYPLSMLLDANVARQETPNLNRDGVVTGATDTVGLGAELRKQFAWGTGLAFRLEGSWTRARFPILPNLPDTITLGPGYDLGARFTITQPLLRGFGTDVGEAELRAARYRRTSLDHARERVASETLRDVLTAYWELWFAGESLRIEREARALAARERDELQARIDAGATAGVDIYAFETRVRERDEAQTLADLERRQRSLELGRRMGRRRATALAAAATVPPTPETLEPEAELLTRALAQAPELAQLDAEVAAARDRERTAGEADRQRLDLTGALETRGLGNRDAGAAVRQFGRLGAFSAQLGLVYELPLTGSRVDSLRAAARAAHAAAAARRDEAALRIETTLSQSYAQAGAARSRIELADATAAAAERQLAAARDRFTLGDGLAIDVERAEDALRRAKLRAARARVDLAQSRATLDHQTGALLSRFADALKLQSTSGQESAAARARRQHGFRGAVGPF